ncbi:MAG: diguanylate cyclase domain-containing protein [Nitrospiraceae bacterium]
MARNPINDATQGASVRVPLVVLQLLFTFFLSYHVQLEDLVTGHDAPTLGLIVLAMAILCLPNSLLNTRWAIFFLTAANTALLVKLTQEARTIEPGLYLGYVLVMLTASFSPSHTQFLVLGGLLSIVYGTSVYQFGALSAEHSLLVPILFAMALIYVNQTYSAGDDLKPTSETEDRARSEAMCDALTGLPNRAQFTDWLWRAIQCARNNHEFLFAVLFVDLDGFKPINDGLGHKAGDAVLIETARRLHACLRKGDVVARHGGDEFTLLINNVNGKDDAIRVAERVLRKVKEPINIPRKRVQVGASIGIALSTNLHERPEDLIRDADLAMYRAKSQGKGNYAVSDQLRDTKVPEGVKLKLPSKDAAAEVKLPSPDAPSPDIASEASN